MVTTLSWKINSWKWSRYEKTLRAYFVPNKGLKIQDTSTISFSRINFRKLNLCELNLLRLTTRENKLCNGILNCSDTLDLSTLRTSGWQGVLSASKQRTLQAKKRFLRSWQLQIDSTNVWKNTNWEHFLSDKRQQPHPNQDGSIFWTSGCRPQKCSTPPSKQNFHSEEHQISFSSTTDWLSRWIDSFPGIKLRNWSMWTPAIQKIRRTTES